MKTAEQAAAAEQETQEQMEARLSQEAIEAGDVFDPADGRETDNGAENKGQEKKPEPEPEIDAETLAAIAGEEKPKMVPHSRFNEVNEEAKAHRARVLELEEELARVKGGATAAAPKEEKQQDQGFNFDDAEERYTAAVLDGDSTMAKQIRAEIRKEEQAAADARAEAAADRRYQANRQKDDEHVAKVEFDLELAKAYAAHPFLDSDSADKNQDAIEETLVWHQHFINKGEKPAKALASAVQKVAPRYANTEPAPAATPKVDVAQGLARAEKVPARAEGLGERANALDVSKMTNKDIKALSAEDEARLAGNFV